MVLFGPQAKLPGWGQQIIEADTVQYYYMRRERKETDLGPMMVCPMKRNENGTSTNEYAKNISSYGI